MTTVAILSASILLLEEIYNWGESFENLFHLFSAWLSFVTGLLVTFKMLMVMFATKVILTEINKNVYLLVRQSDNLVELGDLVNVHATLCELVGEANRIFQPVLMCCHLMNFFNILTGSYFITLIAANLEKSFEKIIGSMLLGSSMWIILSAMSVVLICTECDKTVFEVCCQIRDT